MGRTKTIDLGEPKSYVDWLVATDEYITQSEVVGESLRLLKEIHVESNLNERRRLIEAGDASGEPSALLVTTNNTCCYPSIGGDRQWSTLEIQQCFRHKSTAAG